MLENYSFEIKKTIDVAFIKKTVLKPESHKCFSAIVTKIASILFHEKNVDFLFFQLRFFLYPERTCSKLNPVFLTFL